MPVQARQIPPASRVLEAGGKIERGIEYYNPLGTYQLMRIKACFSKVKLIRNERVVKYEKNIVDSGNH